MLSLTRRIGEEVTLVYEGKTLGTFKIMLAQGDKCRIGFDMPKEVGVYRTELIKNGIVERLGGKK